MYSKVALAAMIAVIIAGFVYMTPGLNTAVFGTNAKTGPPEVKTPEVHTSNPAVNTVATGAILVIKGMDTSYQGNLPDGTRNIGTLIAINGYPTEFRIDGTDIYVTGFKISSDQISGYVENRGKETYGVTPDFVLVKQDKIGNTGKIGHIYYTGNNAGSGIIKPGEKYPFSSDMQPDVRQALSQTFKETVYIHPDFGIVNK